MMQLYAGTVSNAPSPSSFMRGVFGFSITKGAAVATTQ